MLQRCQGAVGPAAVWAQELGGVGAPPGGADMEPWAVGRVGGALEGPGRYSQVW